jgi:flagellar basal-body rod protein FlgB
MTDGIEAVTTSVLSLALDAAVLRQQAIASNIANANTAGYVRQGVSFDRQVDALAVAAHGQPVRPGQLAQVRLRIEPAAAQAAQAAPVRLDMEVAQMAENAAHYQALLKGIQRHYAILSSAVSDGKR